MQTPMKPFPWLLAADAMADLQGRYIASVEERKWVRSQEERHPQESCPEVSRQESWSWEPKEPATESMIKTDSHIFPEDIS